VHVGWTGDAGVGILRHDVERRRSPRPETPITPRGVAVARAIVVGGLVVLCVAGLSAAGLSPGSALGWLVLVVSLLIAFGLVVVERAERGRPALTGR
jgi:hypothetical protein